MPTKLTCLAEKDNAIIVTIAFEDEDGNAVTPEDPCTWTWSHPDGTVINGRTGVAIVEATSVDIMLTGDDLAARGANDDGFRYLLIEGQYISGGETFDLDRTIIVVIDCQVPLGLFEAKEHLNIEVTETADNYYIATLINTVRDHVENVCKRKLIAQSVTEYFQGWPSYGYFELAYGSLRSVSSVKYRDTDNTEYTMDSSEYVVDIQSGRGRVYLGYGESWPTETLQVVNPIYIAYSCGYGETAADVPAPVVHAMKILLADLFENRETHVLGVAVSTLRTVDHLLRPYILL